MYTRAATADDDGKNYLPGGKLTFQKYEACKKCQKKKTKTKNMPGSKKLTKSKYEMCSI